MSGDNSRVRYKGSLSLLITVIVPVFNTERYLDKAICSLLNQTIYNLEIILVNDGSNDRSYDICKLYAQIDSRIRLINIQKHSGVSVARNIGLSLAQGYYVSFLDADDWMELDMLEYLLDSIQREGADIATCEIVKDYPDGRCIEMGNSKSYKATGGFVIDEINYGGDFNTFLVNKLFRKSILEGITFPEGVTIGEDYYFIMQILMRKPMVFKGGLYKYHYFQRNDSACHKGFVSKEKVYRNRMSFKVIYYKLIRYDENLRSGALAYYILQEMAVITSMAKARCFDKETAKSIQKEIRFNIMEYLKIKRVPIYLKICAILMCMHVYLLLIPIILLRYIFKL